MGAGWQPFVKRVYFKAYEALGVPPEAVTAELHKLVLHGPGESFSQLSCSIGKADSVFATLLFVLTSIYQVKAEPLPDCILH